MGLIFKDRSRFLHNHVENLHLGNINGGKNVFQNGVLTEGKSVSLYTGYVILVVHSVF